MNNDQKLAFWINLYNSLIMHAYLAYGVPRNDIKFFALMQKVSYTIRGQSFSPADIEFVILKMKPPPHHPQIEIIKELMERLPHMKELMDMYSTAGDVDAAVTAEAVEVSAAEAAAAAVVVVVAVVEV
ncbi:uncharacterized protein LOC109820877 [Asparagus officinalis]|uniref:uncharacterized protein LOC109820877 n=1 Tax=Asparagus officinalis TaxID=4686 RepID=UPI00098E8577|nr:uncharacterized protein LOC109820877 [Asparagus officinalis]